MEVVAGDVEPAGEVREPEPDHRPLAGELEHVLVGDDLGQRAVGLRLARDRSSVDAAEAAGDPDRVRGIRQAELLVDRGEEGVSVHRAVELEAAVRLEEGEDRERRSLLGVDRVERAVDVRAQELAVEGDHLAVDGIEGPEPEIAVSGELGEADVAVVGAVEERLDRRGLNSRCGSCSAWSSSRLSVWTWSAF